MERRVRRLEGLLFVTVAVLIGIAAAPVNDSIRAREIILTNPEGNSQIVLRADRDRCLIEMTGNDTRNNAVSIYRTNEAAVIGAYTQDQSNVALATSSKGSILQLSGQQKKVVVTPQNWNPQVSGNPDYEVKF